MLIWPTGPGPGRASLERPSTEQEDDALAAAKGVANSVALSLVIWAVIGLVVVLVVG